MQILFHRRFEKQFEKLPKNIQVRFQGQLELFYEDPFAIKLNNHSLKGKFTGHRSINVSPDIRAVYRIIDEQTCLFTSIGSHSELYS